MSFGNFALLNALLYLFRQAQESQSIRNGAAGFSDFFCDLFLFQFTLLNQSFVSFGNFYRVKVRSLDIFDQSDLEQVFFFRYINYKSRYFFNFSKPGSTQPALASKTPALAPQPWVTASTTPETES